MVVNWTELRRNLIGERVQSVLPPRIPLPMLPTAVMEFNRKADNPCVGAAVLGKIIQTDTGLTAELLRYANSAATGLRTKAATAQQAIAMLGIRPTKLFLLSAGVHQAMKSCKSKLINLQNFSFTNLERALFAKEVAVLLKADADVAFSASMLHDFLLPVLSNELFDQYLKFAETPEKVRRPLVDFEQSAFGWDHCLATAQVMLSWQFPDDLICAVLLHHGGLSILSDPELGRTAVAAVAVAALMPDPLRQSGDGLTPLSQLHEIWPEFDLPALAEDIAAQFVEMCPAGGRHITLQRRLEKMAAASPQPATV
jgi:serine/threonine-protein kinase